MRRFVLLTIAGLICISSDMKSHATTTIGWATPFNEAVFKPTTDHYVTSNSSLKFNRLNRVKAKWSGNDIWEAQARHASNYTLSAHSTTSTSPPKKYHSSLSTTRQQGKGSTHSHYQITKQKHPNRRLPAKVKKSGQLHRRTRPISKKKGSSSTTASTTTMKTTTKSSTTAPTTTGITPKTSAKTTASSLSSSTTSTTTTTTSTTTTTTTPRPEQTANSYKANGYGIGNINAKSKGSMGMPLPSANKHKRKPLRPAIKITVSNRPNKTAVTTVATTTTLSSSKPTKTVTKSTPAPIVKLPSHLTKRPILPSRITQSTPAPVHLSTTTQKYYPKTSNTLLSLISASTTPAVTIPNTPFLFMEENSFLTRLSISLFYSSIAIAPVIFSLFSGLANTKRKRKKREDFYNYMNATTHGNHSRRGGAGGDENEDDETSYKSLAHFPKFVAEKLEEIESTLPTMTNAR